MALHTTVLLSMTPKRANVSAFTVATRGGGAFFGEVGCFEPGFALDAVVLDDSALVHPQELTPIERLERCIYLADERHIAAKYVAGTRLF